MTSPSDVFLTPEALRINRARLHHLATLGLDLRNKRVLEVGAGIGLHTGFFEERGCDILSTDGNSANVAEMLARYPHRRLGLLDLDLDRDLTGLESFDVVYCYGTLYHLRYPDRALVRLAAVCTGMILLETVVLPGNYPEVQLIREPLIANQAVCGFGCRPTRSWVMSALQRHFGHAYTTFDQPDYPDFATDWSLLNHDGNLRAVFVGSKKPISTTELTETLPVRHRNALPRISGRRYSRTWIDVGAHHGEHSLAAAANDPSLLVHAFEPLPTLHDKLVKELQPNFTAHPMAVSDHDGTAVFRINSFDAASSLLALNEAARSNWTGGHLLREERELVVPTTRLDTFMRDNKIATVEFLKIDAQGADFSVVRSLGDRISDVQRIQLEVVPSANQLYRGAAAKQTIVAYMAEHGFALEKTEDQSHGQEQNLTFARLSLAPEPMAVARADGDDEINGIYDLRNYATVAGSVHLEGERMEVATAPAQWAYTVQFPVDRSRAPERSTVRLKLKLEVDVGVLQVGILNTAETQFITTATHAAGPVQTVELVVSRADHMGPLVVRNASEDGPSRGWCQLLGARIEMPTELQSEKVHNIEEMSFLTSQIRASAQALARTTADPGSELAPLREVEEAAELLRGLLSWSGLALIRAHTTETGETFAGLDIEILHKLADHLKILLPLRPMPGWRFDEFLARPDLATLVRYSLWKTLHSLPFPPTIALPWHGGTTFTSRFDNDLSMAMFVGGSFEPNEFALLDRLIRPGMNVVDGGANEGVYSLFLACKVGPIGRVIAVEPSAREFMRLSDNVTTNNLNNVSLVASALAERAGEISLRIAEAAHAGQNTVGDFAYEGITSVGTEVVPTTTVDELAAVHGLNVDVIKLDIEGAELRALMGATNVLRTARPLVLLELSGAALAHQGASVNQLSALFDRADYKLFRFDYATGLPVPLGDGKFSDNILAVHSERDWDLPML